MDGDDLYGLPLDRFVPERTALSRALRAQGQREQAGAVAARTKPSVAAWAVNQLVRTQKRELTALLRTGDALRQAQDGVLTGHGDGHSLRAAAEAERTAVDALVTAARGLLTTDGHQLSAPILERVAETLHAGALDDDARDQVMGGCLERELRHVGFGAGAAASAAPGASGSARRAAKRGRATPPRAERKPAEPQTAKRQPAERQRAERQRAERERAKQERADQKRAEQERAEARKAARAAATAARRRADRATRALKQAQQRRDQAAETLAEADQALASAQAEADAAAEADARAQQDL